MTNLKWEAPAPDGRSKIDWRSVFGELREHPGEWALISEDAPASTSTHIKNGKYAGSEAGEFEATTRNQVGSRAKIYARYVGTKA